MSTKSILIVQILKSKKITQSMKETTNGEKREMVIVKGLGR